MSDKKNMENSPPTSGGGSARDGSLSCGESESLRRCEEIIAEGMETFLKVGRALLTVSRDRLYRGDHATFQEYCGQRWGFSRAHAYRLIASARVLEVLSPIGDIRVPDNECQIRPLIRLPESRQAEVWREACRRSGEKAPTGAAVLKVAREFDGSATAAGAAPHLDAKGRMRQIRHLLHDALACLRADKAARAEEIIERVSRLLNDSGNGRSPQGILSRHRSDQHQATRQ